jgi:hypothetical protein
MAADWLTGFIVRAKAATYVGAGHAVRPTRPGSHDLSYEEPGRRYSDSYFGGTDFLGQEVVWQDDVPVWAMNYGGRVLDGAAIDGARAAKVIRAALPLMYAEGRFLGGFRHLHGPYRYEDRSTGDTTGFRGIEVIRRGGLVVYRLDYQGGRIRE